jgi:hypothetical protein
MYMARSSDNLLNLNTMSIEKLTGRLRVREQDNDDEQNGLCKWRAAAVHGGAVVYTHEVPRRRRFVRSGDNHRTKGLGTTLRVMGAREAQAVALARDDKCSYYGKLGHWSTECHKEKREDAHLTKDVDDDKPDMLLMAQLCPTDEELEHIARQAFLDEECAKVHLGDKWELVDVPYFLDNGASNHMTNNKDVFADHDIKIVHTVRFGVNSILDIRERVTVVIMVQGDKHHQLGAVQREWVPFHDL